MVISLALLGFGASGTFLTFARRRLEPRFALAFAGFAAAFGVSAPGCFALALRVPFNPLEVIWDLAQQRHLLGLYLLLALPFFFSGTCIGLALTRYGERIAAIYRSDLLGAGAGAAFVVLALYAVPAEDGLRLVSSLGLLAAALGTMQESPRRLPAIALLVAAVAVPLAWPAAWIEAKPSQYKGLSLALNAPDARIVAERTSPLGWLAAVESPTIPFRHAPGLSLTAEQEPPPQIGLFTDGGGMSAITRFEGDLESVRYLDGQTAALPTCWKSRKP